MIESAEDLELPWTETEAGREAYRLAEQTSVNIDIHCKWYKDGVRTHEYAYEATDRWDAAGNEYDVYSAGTTGNNFIFPSVGERRRASALCSDLWERMRAENEVDDDDLPEWVEFDRVSPDQTAGEAGKQSQA
jgi:hypothetical protein